MCAQLHLPLRGLSPPGSSIHGILQARILEWVDISFSRGSSQPRDRTCVSCTAGRFFTTEPPGKFLHCVPVAALISSFRVSSLHAPQVMPLVDLLLSLKAGRPVAFVAGPGFWEVGISPSRGQEDEGQDDSAL